MSFSKSKVTRFNESKGCAPAVGSYNVNQEIKVPGAAMIGKAQRFREIQDASNGSMDASLLKSSSMGELRTPNKANLSLIHGVERRRKLGSTSSPRHQAENGKIKELETKIKHLLVQEAEMGRRLHQAQEKADKLDGKLQAAIKEKSQLQAQLAKSEKQVLELSRSKDVLKNKVETLENSHVRHNSASEELETTKRQLTKKEKELEHVQIDLTNRVHSLQADLKAAHSIIQALRETKQALEQTNREIRNHGEAIEEEIRQLQGLADSLRQENQRVHDELDLAEEQQQATECCMETMRHTMAETEARLHVSVTTVSDLEQSKTELSLELAQAESTITTLQDQESNLKDQISRLEVQLSALQSQHDEERERRNKAEEQVESLKEELKRTETSTNESLKQMSDKYQSLEAILGQVEADLTWEGDTHKAQLAAADAVSQQRAAECEALQIQNKDLLHAYSFEKEQCDLLLQQVNDLTDDKKDMEQIGLKLNEQEKHSEEMKKTRLELEERLQQLEREKSEAEDRVQTLEQRSHEEQLLFETEKTQLSAALSVEKGQVDYLQKQLQELGEEMEDEMDEVNGLDERVKSQEDEMDAILSDKAHLRSKLEELHKEKANIFKTLKDAEQAREADQQINALEHDRLCAELSREKEKVSGLEQQLKELNADFEELSGIESRLNNQERAVEGIQLEKDRLQTMLKLAENKLSSAEQAVHKTQADKKGVELSLEEQLQLTASLEDRLKVMQKAKESLVRQVDLLEAAKKKISADLLSGQQQVHRLECEAASATQESSKLRCQFEGVETKWKVKVQDLEAACTHQRQEFGRRLVDTQTKLSQKESELGRVTEEHDAKVAQMRGRLEERIEDLELRLQQLQEDAENHTCFDEEAGQILQEEADSWKAQFEELTAKVAPFQDQLDQFEIEKRLLLTQNNAAQGEVNKLSKDYAKLLGHQNQKQKIHHIMRIKEENIGLKKEVAKLREETTRQTRSLRQLKDKVDRAEGRKKFDPSAAFSHGKENKTPLAQRNI